MTKASNRNLPGPIEDASVWTPVGTTGETRLISAQGIRRMEINSAPVTEQSHEYVIRNLSKHAPNR